MDYFNYFNYFTTLKLLIRLNYQFHGNSISLMRLRSAITRGFSVSAAPYSTFALKGPLHGVKVLELASVLAGPSVGQFMAELGATIIKVENMKTCGDVTRGWKLPSERKEELSAYFSSCNWGKRSVAVDLGTEDGRKIIQDLALRVST